MVQYILQRFFVNISQLGKIFSKIFLNQIFQKANEEKLPFSVNWLTNKFQREGEEQEKIATLEDILQKKERLLVDITGDPNSFSRRTFQAVLKLLRQQLLSTRIKTRYAHCYRIHYLNNSPQYFGIMNPSEQ
jgi:hypothetical protein